MSSANDGIKTNSKVGGCIFKAVSLFLNLIIQILLSKMAIGKLKDGDTRKKTFGHFLDRWMGKL